MQRSPEEVDQLIRAIIDKHYPGAEVTISRNLSSEDLALGYLAQYAYPKVGRSLMRVGMAASFAIVGSICVWVLFGGAIIWTGFYIWSMLRIEHLVFLAMCHYTTRLAFVINEVMDFPDGERLSLMRARLNHFGWARIKILE